MKGINKIKIVIVGFFVMLPSLCLFSEDTLFDFDGKNNNHEGIINFSNKSLEDNCIKKAFIMDEKGELKESIPFYSYVDEKDRRVNEHYFLPQQKVRWELSCKNSENKPWTATETYLYVYGTGGHYHNDPLPPYLKITNVRTDGNEPANSSFKEKPSPFDFPYMMSNVKYYYWEKMPEFSIRIAEYFKSKDGCNGEQLDYLNVLVPGLEVLTAGSGYNLVGETDSHPYNHYGTKLLIDTLISIANEYKSNFPEAEPLNINDMSLIWGGLFDVNNNWKPPHNLHRCGNQADIGKITIPKANRRKFIEVVCKKTKFLLSEEEPPHYHISVNQNEPYYCNKQPLTEVEKGDYTKCCNDDGTINETNIEECIKIK
ncbi:MAG: hypothetical protein KA059_05065 [Elusimicrobiales bacterium]|nr:hypothetical protein [Elusimicrobiales bacterium]